MGTLVAVKKGDEVALGSDSLNASDSGVRPEYCKSGGCLIEVGGSYVGLSSSPAYQHAFEAALKNLDGKKIPPLHSVENVFEFFLKMHEILRNHYGMYVNFQQGQEFEWSPMNSLVISSNGIYRIDSNRSVCEFSSFGAIGTAQAYALGALEALRTSKKSATQLVQATLEVTCKMESLNPDAIHIRTIKNPTLKVTSGSAGKSRRKKATSKSKSLKPVKGGKK